MRCRSGGSEDRRLADGQTVVGVGQSIKLLPQVRETAAELIVDIPAPDSQLIADLIRKVSVGKVPGSFKTVYGGLLDLDEIGALVGSGGNAQQICDRIVVAVTGKTRTARTGERLPRMEGAVEWARRGSAHLVLDAVHHLAGGLLGSGHLFNQVVEIHQSAFVAFTGPE